ncbi:MAG TPA: hypothetical protein VE644_14275 [Gaiellaceae bacterium]|jgi:hypothetical protein|nr:hypothetical protein [Gaiellaceae bacterium]
MSTLGPRAARERERGPARRARRSGLLTWALRLLVLAVVFLAGVVIGRALESAPRPGGTQTIVRTIEPLTVPPAERTVTVTTSAP